MMSAISYQIFKMSLCVGVGAVKHVRWYSIWYFNIDEHNAIMTWNEISNGMASDEDKSFRFRKKSFNAPTSRLLSYLYIIFICE